MHRTALMSSVNSLLPVSTVTPEPDGKLCAQNACMPDVYKACRVYVGHKCMHCLLQYYLRILSPMVAMLLDINWPDSSMIDLEPLLDRLG